MQGRKEGDLGLIQAPALSGGWGFGLLWSKGVSVYRAGRPKTLNPENFYRDRGFSGLFLEFRL